MHPNQPLCDWKGGASSNLIDFHNHILPTVDDGASSLDISISMLQHAQEQGITDVVNTVHFQHPKMEERGVI